MLETVVYSAHLEIYPVHLSNKKNPAARRKEGACMNKKLVKLGVGGGIITAICCFTPVLVWIFGAIGLVAVVAYLDYVLFPLLAVFLVVVVIGLLRKESNDINKT
jgi:mercuric ion transport protein